MKKILTILLISCSLVFVPVFAKADIENTDLVQSSVSMDQELKMQLIDLLKQMIVLLQQQLNAMIAQQNALNQIAQNTVLPVSETIPAPALVTAPSLPTSKLPDLTVSCNGLMRPDSQYLLDFTVAPVGGDGSYVYNWSGCQGGGGDGAERAKKNYACWIETPGVTIKMKVEVTSNNQTKSAECMATSN